MGDFLLGLRLGLADRAHFVSRLLRLPAGRQPRVGRQPAKLHGTTHSIERDKQAVTCRTWRLFMSGSACQFANGSHNIYQSLLVKQDRGKSGLPLTRADWYRPTTESHRSSVWSL